MEIGGLEFISEAMFEKYSRINIIGVDIFEKGHTTFQYESGILREATKKFLHYWSDFFKALKKASVVGPLVEELFFAASLRC